MLYPVYIFKRHVHGFIEHIETRVISIDDGSETKDVVTAEVEDSL